MGAAVTDGHSGHKSDPSVAVLTPAAKGLTPLAVDVTPVVTVLTPLLVMGKISKKLTNFEKSCIIPSLTVC